MLMFIVSISFAQYTPMTAAGYQFKRILCDSTLHIPSFCGIPTLRNSTAKNGAIAMDTCNNKLYKWTRAAGWSDISGGGIDSLKRSTDSIFARKAGVWVFQYKDSVGGGGGGSQNLQQVTDLGNTTTNALIVDDALAQVTKLGLTDYLNNLVYPFRYSNVFGSAFDLKDDLSGFPPFLNGYSSTLGDAFYKMGIESNKAILQVDGGSNTNNSSIKLTENELRFSEGGNVTSIKTNPSGNSASYFLPMNVGVDQTLLADAPNDGSKYARQNGTWVSFTTGGGTGTVTDISQGYGITASPTNPITTSGTIDVDTTTSGLSGKYLRIVDTTGKWASATASFVPYTGATLNVNLGDKTLKGEAIYAKESFYLRDTTLSGNYLVIQKDGDKGAILFANNSGGGLNGNVSLSVNNMSGSARTINLPDSNGTLALKEYTIDSLKRSSDSVYARKNGQWNFQYKDSVGSGGGGGGSAVSYYLNGSISQGTIGGVAYKQLKVTPVIGAGTNFTINADGYISQFITDVASPNKTLIPGGNWNFETYFSASSSGGSPSFYIELYKYDGTTFTLIASNSTTPESITGGTSIDLYFSALAVPTTILSSSDRLAVRFFVTHSGRTITMHTENSHLSQIITTFPSGITELNGLTAQQQSFGIGTSGTDFNINSASDIHTFNLPTASAANRGALSFTDWSTFNGKIGASDTSVFQRKSISANTIMANNTASAANVTAQAFYDKPEQAYTGTITFTGTAPTTIINNTYQWSQVGKTVTLFVNLLYSGGNSTTNIVFDLPSDCPTPSVPSGYIGASSVLYFGTYSVSNSLTSILRNGQSQLRRNSANTAYEITTPAWAAIVSRNFQFQITYRAQ
ncbi:hypothetical protein UFOVP778_4 [uncultured Caudovirales phage]|uniref:Uncharacterized protein n=1 Tax=uncultured Caudovirales phage TaxID=2100421 RepID=A0A6J5NPQ4_9CAUD|nr:hypothetical protein UFOVP778_4 [uncultured Caudovirales phage]